MTSWKRDPGAPWKGTNESLQVSVSGMLIVRTEMCRQEERKHVDVAEGETDQQKQRLSNTVWRKKSPGGGSSRKQAWKDAGRTTTDTPSLAALTKGFLGRVLV